MPWKLVRRLVTGVLLLTYMAGAGQIVSQGFAAAQATITAWATRPAPPPVLAPTMPHTPDPLAGLPVWGGRERVTVLLLGVDSRPDEIGDPGRTDFVAVATLDPVTHSGGLLSFPRDLWVTIPLGNNAYAEERINVAYRYGEIYKLPGGGTATARRTIEYNFGIRTDFSVLIDFDGFTRLIDRLGGVLVDVETPLKDNEYPTDNYGYERIYFAPGLQTLNGKDALQYARSRHQDSDFERNKRQQQVLLGLRRRIMEMDMLPRLPAMLFDIRDYVKTDLNPTQIIALARLAWGIDPSDLVVRSIGGDAVVNSPGSYVLLPRREAISAIIGEVFSDPEIRREAAQVVLISAPANAGDAEKAAGMIRRYGIQVTVETRPAVDVGTAPVIIDRTGKVATSTVLKELLSADVVAESTGTTDETADIVVHYVPPAAAPS